MRTTREHRRQQDAARRTHCYNTVSKTNVQEKLNSPMRQEVGAQSRSSAAATLTRYNLAYTRLHGLVTKTSSKSHVTSG